MNSPDTDLVVHRHGRSDGPDLLLVHGLTDCSGGWSQAVEHWKDTYRVTTLDLRGHGESPRFTAAQLDEHPGDVMVDDVVAVAGRLDRPVLVGHSLGGAVALTVAARHPDLVRALVLEDPAPRSPEEPQRLPERGRQYLDELAPSRAAADDDELVAARREQHPGWPEKELLPTGRAEQQVQDDYLLRGDWKPTEPWPSLLERLTVPALLLTGDNLDEVVISPELEEGMRAAAPALEVRRLEGAGHCVRRDRQDVFYAVVDEWLVSLGQRGASS
ncbi:MAG TPA: alpha/beta fold hydrolase [Marmoricola sp.]|nr:alpha/beta fold hydrolase [Marmoricola sp.]